LPLSRSLHKKFNDDIIVYLIWNYTYDLLSITT
jgi:hypothetical protein